MRLNALATYPFIPPLMYVWVDRYRLGQVSSSGKDYVILWNVANRSCRSPAACQTTQNTTSGVNVDIHLKALWAAHVWDQWRPPLSLVSCSSSRWTHLHFGPPICNLSTLLPGTVTIDHICHYLCTALLKYDRIINSQFYFCVTYR